MNLFDYATAVKLRDTGIEKVSSYPNDSWVSEARAFAISHAASYGEVSSDDIHLGIKHGLLSPPPKNAHHNVMGAVFSGLRKHLKRIDSRPSHRPESHAREIKVYELREYE